MTDASGAREPEEVTEASPPSEGEFASPADADADVDVVDLGELDLAEVVDIPLLLKEREEFLSSLQRLQAEFENYKKRMVRQQTEHVERAAGVLIEKLLPVIDTFDLAIAHGAEGLEPVYRSLVDTLAAEGLERLDPMGAPFDPNEHDAVAHEPGDTGHPEVIEVLRAGYRWKGRVLRPAMVKVKG
jgi:molecular chaperone GrpE